MSSTRVLWGQICAALGIVLVTMWAATQWVAWKLGFQPRLGPPWFVLIGGPPVYYPPAFFWWWLVYDVYAPKIFMQGACIAAYGFLVSERETIPPSATGSGGLFKEITIPETYRPRGSAIAA